MANEKILNTRVQLKYDTLANWNASTFIPKKGEMCIATVDTAQKDAKGNIITVPTLLIKVGSGAEGATFSTLPFVSAPAADVYDWAKKDEATFVKEFLSMKNGNTTMQALLDGVFATDAELSTAIAGVQSQIDALADRMATAEDKITALETDLAAHKENVATIHNMQAQTDAALLTKIQENRQSIADEAAAREALALSVAQSDEALENQISDVAKDLAAHKENVANIHNMQAQNDAALLTKIQKNRDDIAANKAAQDAVNAAQAETNATLNAGIEKNAADLVAHKNDMATIHDLQGQIDAELSLRIKTNKQDIAANKAAQDEVNAGVAADIKAINATIAANKNAQDEVNAAQAETNATLAADIAKNAEDLVAHKNNMAEIHNMQAQTDAALLGKIQENRTNIAAEIERATAAEKANADEIARVNAVLEAAIENDGEGLDSIKELATWVAEHGVEAEAIVKSVEDEAAARKAADEQLSKDITAVTEASDAADAALAKDIADFKSEFVGYKNEQAQIHNMQAQNDAALLVKIQQNRENLANEVAAREALEATALQTVSTGVGLKATKTGTDAKVEIDDSVVFVFDCGSATTNID